MTKAKKGNLMLLAAALIWGCAFVAQSVGMDYVGPFTFLGIRFLLAGAALVPVIKGMDRKKAKAGCPVILSPKERTTTLAAGVLCGVALFAGSAFQQVGILYTTVGKAGFVTALYIFFVPILGLLFKRKVPLKIWGCVAVAVAGLYLLCMQEGFYLSRGDSLVFLCAIGFACQIMLVDRYVSRVDGVRLSCIQFFTTGVLGCIFMVVLEQPKIEAVLAAGGPILYAALLSSAVGYTLQTLGQRYTHPTVASLLMSLESVFAVLAGVVVLRETPTLREGMGCALMFAAIVLAQLPSRSKGTASPEFQEGIQAETRG